MPSRVLFFRCLIISPSDVTDARDALERVMAEWNAHIGVALGARVEAVRWETHATPEMGERPQAIINKQLVDSCDMGVAVFWSRLGTPTGTHESGSVEEIERLLARNSRVLVYFSAAPVPQVNAGSGEFQRLQAVRKNYESKGLLGSYEDIGALERIFQLHLTSTMAALLLQGEQRDQPIPAVGTATAPRPDIRVRVQRANIFGSSGDPTDVLQARVENHSPSDFFLSSVSVVLENGAGLWQGTDPVTFERQIPRVIRPGDSHAFHFFPHKLAESAKGARMTHVVATDKIGREYRSPDGMLEAQLALKEPKTPAATLPARKRE